MGNIGPDNMPFARFLLPAGAGILLAAYTGASWGYFAVCFAVVWLAGYLSGNGNAAGFYTWLSVLSFFAGVSAFTAREPVEDIAPGMRIIAEITVSEEPAEARRWQRAKAYSTAYRHEDVNIDDPSEWLASGFGVQLYADTSLAVLPGQKIVAAGSFYPFSREGGSYESLMIRRGIAGRLFVRGDGLIVSGRNGTDGLSPGNRMHNASVRKFSALPSDGLQGVSAAMVTGDKRFVPKEVRQNYTDGGGAHLLAVSGLHVGIVFLLVNLILYFIPAMRKGHIVKNVIAVTAVWAFAVSAGLSPSVVRAALMFSFAQAALAKGTVKGAVNIIAASAFLMLAYDPNYASDPSFVLSYAAVLSIILFAGPVFSLVKTGYRAVDAVLSVLIVGLAASLASAPFVSYWFGAVPLAGIIVNPVVIFTAHIIVAVGVVWLVWPFGFGGEVFSRLLGIAEGCQNAVMEWCAGLSWGIIEVRLPLGMAILAYTLVIISAVYLGRYSDARRKALSLPA